MSDAIRCPDCGHANPPGSTSCAACNYPLHEGVPPAEAPAPEPASAGEPGTPVPPPIPRRRIARPRRPRQDSKVTLTLWLGAGGFVTLLLIFIAVRANLERTFPPVEGTSAQQQQQANALRAALEKDSTDTHARVSLADLLFDTGNWSEAIIHYRSAVHHDSTLVPALVDLGVCYYNLGHTDNAERHFRLALARDPHQPFALFNLGIVHERRGEPDRALEVFHRALQSAPPERMKPALVEAMQRVAKLTGKSAPPLGSSP